ncbi:hypothetical protein [Dickeya solani]|nr:hypothetical protein [Dickeya solani]AUC41464.1 hypothetical protein D083_1114 [Dickeya solani RNS 08.23.3.1.A]MCZ0797115.1 hypothetical protein [Dickeya solani]WCD42837.1 hypothetical protein OQ522_21420 [Dickeya solani]WCF59255.1 hypothetical protein OQ520_21420 [Dickeya solani]
MLTQYASPCQTGESPASFFARQRADWLIIDGGVKPCQPAA